MRGQPAAFRRSGTVWNVSLLRYQGVGVGLYFGESSSGFSKVTQARNSFILTQIT